MFDPSSITLGQVSSSVRDFAIVGTLLTVSWKIITLSWKGRGVYEKIVAFFDRTMEHMDAMEAGMNTLLSNHLTHIAEELKQMSNHQERILSGDEAIHIVDDEAPSGK